MEADDEELPLDCKTQVKRVKATLLTTFEQTCHDIGAGRFSHDQLAEIVQLESLHSEPCQATVG